jgi:nicotinate-nucleotide adenylyltransferase
MDGPAARIGVLGGSFNPPHLGHLVIASDAWAQLGLDRVLFVPAADPPHKRLAGGLPVAARVRMVAAAIVGDARFALSTVEVHDGLRYTVDTVAALRRELPTAELWFIVGSDSLLALHTWHAPAQLLSLCRLAVAPRPGDDGRAIAAAAKEWGDAIVILDSVQVDLSSTEVRRRVARGDPIRYLVPEAVEAIIAHEGWYRSR